jgi:hypothetical protein
MRFDVPVIGTRTLEVAAEVGIHSIGVEAGATLLLDGPESLCGGGEAWYFTSRTMNTIRTGVVGVGHMGMNHARILQRIAGQSPYSCL